MVCEKRRYIIVDKESEKGSVMYEGIGRGEEAIVLGGKRDVEAEDFLVGGGFVSLSDLGKIGDQ